MKNDRAILLFRGLDFGDPSPMNDVHSALLATNPDCPVHIVNWNTPGLLDVTEGITRLLIIAHSFGCNSAYLFCEALYALDQKYMDDPSLDSEIDLVLIDDVRWTTEDDVAQITSFDDSALAQVIDRTPFKIPANVDTCLVFRRGEWPGPITCAVTGPQVTESTIPGTGHNSVVIAVQGALLSKAREFAEAA